MRKMMVFCLNTSKQTGEKLDITKDVSRYP